MWRRFSARDLVVSQRYEHNGFVWQHEEQVGPTNLSQYKTQVRFQGQEMDEQFQK